jgi:diguanylate cyclase (GGDEF)-like protein
MTGNNLPPIILRQANLQKELYMLGALVKIAQRASRRKSAAVETTPQDREQAEASLALARELIHAVEQFVISTPDLDSSRFLGRMRGVAAGLTPAVTPGDIQLYQAWLGNSLRAFGKLQQGYIADRETEMWRLLETYSRSTDISQRGEHQLANQIRGAHHRMRELVSLPDIKAARTQLEEELQQVQRVVKQRQQEEKEQVTALARQVSRLEASLASVRGRTNFDALTGVFHRAHLEDRLRAMLEHGKPVCIALMDVDNFRTINNTLGHAVGDKVLTVLGDQLQRVCRTTDMPTRYGGDEFVFMASGGTSEQLAQRLAGAVARRHVRLEIDDRVVSVLLSVSVGVAASSPGDTLEALMGRAFRALNAVKQEGKGGIRMAS